MPKLLREMQEIAVTTTARLSASYLLIIMVMSIGFSVVFYNTSSHELGRQIPPPSIFGTQRFSAGTSFGNEGPGINDFFAKRVVEGRQALLRKLIILNIVALTAGGVVSYYLARRTLEPIEANMEAQSQFVSDASHELRTPLTALQTTNEVALRNAKLSPKATKELLRYNVAEVEKLRQLTDALLRLAKQDAGQTILQDVTLEDITTDALNSVVSSAVAKHIVVEDTIAKAAVIADRHSISQALAIMLDNAIKYSPAGATIHLEAGQAGKRGYIRVRDEGPGIAASDLPHIFDRFYRADQSRNKQQTEGYGIGLALAKKIVDQHHGEIQAASAEGQGTTFTMFLPLA